MDDKLLKALKEASKKYRALRRDTLVKMHNKRGAPNGDVSDADKPAERTEQR